MGILSVSWNIVMDYETTQISILFVNTCVTDFESAGDESQTLIRW